MANGIIKRLENIFVVSEDDFNRFYKTVMYNNQSIMTTYGSRPARTKLSTTNERSIISSIITRIGIDVSSLDIRHVKLDDDDNYIEELKTPLNECLKLSSNVDQTSTALFQDITMSMLDEGAIAIVPVDYKTNSQDEITEIYNLRVGKIIAWYPQHVKIRCYNEINGREEDIVMSKKKAAIVENPLYSIMNEPNSTAKRLSEKLALLDAADRKANSGKLDIIIQMPYAVKGSKRLAEAKDRVANLQAQLEDSPYGIAYADATEKIIQLNRPAENTLMAQIEYLTRMLYSQLGISEEVFAGTASPEVMLNYHNRTINPIVTVICEAMIRSFITKEARDSGESIKYFRDPFATMPVNEFSNAADNFTRNAILSSNEIRAELNKKPSKDPIANELRNKNLNKSNEEGDAQNEEQKEL